MDEGGWQPGASTPMRKIFSDDFPRDAVSGARGGHTVDFRAVQSGLLEQWLGSDAEAIIPSAAKFTRPQLIR